MATWSDDEHAARKKANQDIPFFWDSAVAEGDTSGTFYTTEVEKVKKEYAEKKGGQNGVVDFDFSTLGDCGKDNFGWDSNSPCVFFRLNRVSIKLTLFFTCQYSSLGGIK